MDLEHMVGMQPALYHRYNVDENEEEEDEDNEPFKTTFNADSFHGTQVGLGIWKQWKDGKTTRE
jgi:hypothetical protein